MCPVLRLVAEAGTGRPDAGAVLDPPAGPRPVSDQRCLICGKNWTRGRGGNGGGRGLCDCCYSRAYRAGTLTDYPRSSRSQADLVADILVLREQGFTRPQMAQRLGMKRKSFDRAHRRAELAGALPT